MLKPLYSGREPLGQFDGLDTEIFTIKGGEVVTFGSTALTSGDKAAPDVYDGYQNPTPASLTGGTRTVVTLFKNTAARPLMLADEGLTGYGTMFGNLVGASLGTSTVGTAFGPHSAAASGKITCWDKPGVYAVTLDAVDSSTIKMSGAGQSPTIAGGAPLYSTNAGLLTTTVSSGNRVGTFIEFNSGGSLVNTAAGMAVALSGAGAVDYAKRNFRFAMFHFEPNTGV